MVRDGSADRDTEPKPKEILTKAEGNHKLQIVIVQENSHDHKFMV